MQYFNQDIALLAPAELKSILNYVQRKQKANNPYSVLGAKVNAKLRPSYELIGVCWSCKLRYLGYSVTAFATKKHKARSFAAAMMLKLPVVEAKVARLQVEKKAYENADWDLVITPNKTVELECAVATVSSLNCTLENTLLTVELYRSALNNTVSIVETLKVGIDTAVATVETLKLHIGTAVAFVEMLKTGVVSENELVVVDANAVVVVSENEPVVVDTNAVAVVSENELVVVDADAVVSENEPVVANTNVLEIAPVSANVIVSTLDNQEWDTDFIVDCDAV